MTKVEFILFAMKQGLTGDEAIMLAQIVEKNIGFKA